MTPPAPGSRAGSDVLANLALWFIAAVFALAVRPEHGLPGLQRALC